MSIKKPNPNTVTLDEAIQREGQTITEVTVRKPGAGELRGVSLADIAQMDVAATIKVLPRVTEPMLMPPELEKMNPADLLQLAMKVAGFLLPKAEREASLTV